MEQTHGTWGNRIRIHQSDTGLVTHLVLEPWQRCSYHFHKKQYNKFYVISGILGVKTDKGYTTKVTKGQMFTVEPEVTHEFQTYFDPTEIIEIAWVEFDEHDIYRQTLGGALEETPNEPER